MRPVRDLSSRVRSTAYEHPESLKEQIYLTTAGDYWPYATSTSRRVDYDHPTPYDDTGPPDPGRPRRRGHTTRAPRPTAPPLEDARRLPLAPVRGGTLCWLSAHGLAYLVDHLGTRRIDPDKAQAIFEAPPGVDLHFATGGHLPRSAHVLAAMV